MSKRSKRIAEIAVRSLKSASLKALSRSDAEKVKKAIVTRKSQNFPNSLLPSFAKPIIKDLMSKGWPKPVVKLNQVSMEESGGTDWFEAYDLVREKGETPKQVSLQIASKKGNATLDIVAGSSGSGYYWSAIGPAGRWINKTGPLPTLDDMVQAGEGEPEDSYDFSKKLERKMSALGWSYIVNTDVGEKTGSEGFRKYPEMIVRAVKPERIVGVWLQASKNDRMKKIGTRLVSPDKARQILGMEEQ